MPRIGVGLGLGLRRASAVGAFDADYQAVLNYATTQGYTLPSAGQQTLQNQLLVDLKNAGIWNKLDSFRVYATNGSSSYALIDWKRLVLCTAVNSPTFTTNVGYKGDGTSSYIDSNFTPSTNGVNYTLNSASIFAYVSSVRTSGQIQAYQGLFFGTSWILLSASTASLGESYVNSMSGVNNGSSGIGFQIVNRTNSTTQNVYYQGNLQGTNSSSASISLPTGSIWDFAANNNSTGTFFSDIGSAIVGYGANLTAEQSDFNNAVNAYMTSI